MADTPGVRSASVARVGVILMGASVVLWLALFGVPLLPLETESRIGVAGALVVAAEVVFWLGAALAGPEATRRFKQWRRSKLRLPFRPGATADMRAEEISQNGSDSSYAQIPPTSRDGD